MDDRHAVRGRSSDPHSAQQRRRGFPGNRHCDHCGGGSNAPPVPGRGQCRQHRAGQHQCRNRSGCCRPEHRPECQRCAAGRRRTANVHADGQQRRPAAGDRRHRRRTAACEFRADRSDALAGRLRRVDRHLERGQLARRRRCVAQRAGERERDVGRQQRGADLRESTRCVTGQQSEPPALECGTQRRGGRPHGDDVDAQPGPVRRSARHCTQRRTRCGGSSVDQCSRTFRPHARRCGSEPGRLRCADRVVAGGQPECQRRRDADPDGHAGWPGEHDRCRAPACPRHDRWQCGEQRIDLEHREYAACGADGHCHGEPGGVSGQWHCAGKRAGDELRRDCRAEHRRQCTDREQQGRTNAYRDAEHRRAGHQRERDFAVQLPVNRRRCRQLHGERDRCRWRRRLDGARDRNLFGAAAAAEQHQRPGVRGCFGQRTVRGGRTGSGGGDIDVVRCRQQKRPGVADDDDRCAGRVRVHWIVGRHLRGCGRPAAHIRRHRCAARPDRRRRCDRNHQ